LPLSLFLLIILTAVAHTSWNILLKKSQDKITFLRSFLFTASIIFIPFLFFIEPPTTESFKFLAASLFIHIFYNIYLCKMYSHSEISFSYPIARGSPTLILLFISPLLLGDQISFLNKIGALIMIGGIFFLIFSEGNYKKINFKGLGLSLIVACTIVAYTLVDAQGARISQNVISYGIYMFALEGITFNIAFMFFFRDQKIQWVFVSKEKYKILFASFLVTFAYLPILYAFTKFNVPSVAALREISILFTSIYGVYFLKERFGIIKVVSSILVVIGCIIIRVASS
jgi:drug/metabolite transporter (DMT)-like permease|tara:strand:+ start:7990 stop:8844 length:855 start_codon:yes stop_codon:yes gene_type:complete